MDYIANHAYCVTLAVSLGQLRTLIEEPHSMTHAALPPEVKHVRGLEDWRDIIHDLQTVLEQI